MYVLGPPSFGGFQHAGAGACVGASVAAGVGASVGAAVGASVTAGSVNKTFILMSQLGEAVWHLGGVTMLRNP